MSGLPAKPHTSLSRNKSERTWQIYFILYFLLPSPDRAEAPNNVWKWQGVHWLNFVTNWSDLSQDLSVNGFSTKCECFSGSIRDSSGERDEDEGQDKLFPDWVGGPRSTNLVSFQFSGISYNDPGNGFWIKISESYLDKIMEFSTSQNLAHTEHSFQPNSTRRNILSHSSDILDLGHAVGFIHFSHSWNWSLHQAGAAFIDFRTSGNPTELPRKHPAFS